MVSRFGGCFRLGERLRSGLIFLILLGVIILLLVILLVTVGLLVILLIVVLVVTLILIIVLLRVVVSLLRCLVCGSRSLFFLVRVREEALHLLGLPPLGQVHAGLISEVGVTEVSTGLDRSHRGVVAHGGTGFPGRESHSLTVPFLVERMVGVAHRVAATECSQIDHCRKLSNRFMPPLFFGSSRLLRLCKILHARRFRARGATGGTH